MGSLVAGYCGVEPFAIDQTVTVGFGTRELDWLSGYEDVLRSFGGNAGCLAEDRAGRARLARRQLPTPTCSRSTTSSWSNA